MPSIRLSVVTTVSAFRGEGNDAASSPMPTVTHSGGEPARSRIRAINARSPSVAMVMKKPPLCRVGRSNEPAQAGGATLKSHALGFLAPRHAHHAASRLSYL